MKTLRLARPSCGGFFDPETKRAELDRLEEESAKPDFWSDQERAQKILKRRSRLEAAANKAAQFKRDVEDSAVLFEFASEDEASVRELKTTIERLEREVEEAETEMMLSGRN